VSARVRVSVGAGPERRERSWPLGATNLVGRHRTCGVVVDAPHVPAFWLEIRWNGAQWTWRELAGDGVTRAVGSTYPDQWRPLLVGARVRIDDRAWLELEDAAPPGLVLLDIVTGEERSGPELDALVEVRDGLVLPLHADGAPEADLRDGDLLADGRRTWRVLREDDVTPTLRDGFALTHPDVSLELDLRGRRADFVLGTRSLGVQGAPVLVLAAYALARRDGPWDDDGGWLGLAEAHAAWIALGGPATSPPERLNWERAKLRSMLARAGGRDLDALFEVRRKVGDTTIRLNVSPACIALLGTDER
jgi:hypothetical protein